MALHRRTHLAFIDAEIEGTDTFGTKNSDFNSEAKSQPVWDVGEIPEFESIAHQGQRHDLGSLPYIKGLPNPSVGFKTYCEGLGTAAGDGDQAGVTFLTRCFESVFANAAKQNYGSNIVNLTDTSTIIGDTESDSFDPGDVIAYALNSGEVECRLINSSSSDSHTVGILASSDPDDGNVIYGTTCVHFNNTQAVKLARRAQLQFHGLSDEDTWEVYAAYLSAVFDAVGRGEAQTITFSGMGSAFATGVSSSLALGTVLRPLVAAISKVLIAPTGDGQTGQVVDLYNWSLDIQATYAGHPPSATDGSQRVSAWVRQFAVPKLTMVTSLDFNPPGSAASWRECFVNDDQFQWQWQQGRSAGSISGLATPAIRLTKPPTTGETDGIRTQTVEFEVVSGTSLPMLTFFQA